MIRYSLIIIALLLLDPRLATAQSLVLTDCNGFTRAAKSVESNSLNRVEVNVSQGASAPANGTQVTLTNTVTGETVTATAQNGVVAFENVTAGTFSISTTTAGVEVGAVSLGSMGVGAVGAGAAVAGAGVVGGGAVAGVGVAASEVSDAVGGNNDEDTEEPEPTEIPVVPTPEPTAEPIPTIAPTPMDCCDPDAEPTPIDDFFAGAGPTPSTARERKVLSPSR